MKPDSKNGYDKTAEIRFHKTLQFMSGLVHKSEKILDLGPESVLSRLMSDNDYNVTNTGKIDLDYNYEIVQKDFDVVTAFEILEHMVSPFPLLYSIRAKKLVASVPLKLWFAKAYWNENDPFDRHYHEFEPRQFRMLLEKAGWKIVKNEKWNIYKLDKIGVRPLLRKFTPRYYIVYCERN